MKNRFELKYKLDNAIAPQGEKESELEATTPFTKRGMKKIEALKNDLKTELETCYGSIGMGQVFIELNGEVVTGRVEQALQYLEMPSKYIGVSSLDECFERFCESV